MERRIDTMGNAAYFLEKMIAWCEFPKLLRTNPDQAISFDDDLVLDKNNLLSTSY